MLKMPMVKVFLHKCIEMWFLMPCRHTASNLLAIDLRLDVQIACDGLQYNRSFNMLNISLAIL